MFVSTKVVSAFSGTPTTAEERQILSDAGFVHVTGLKTYGTVEYVIGERTKPADLGKFGQNNGMAAITTIGGEVWVSARPESLTSVILQKFCPNGSGIFVPLSNGEQLATYYLLLRVVEPGAGMTLNEVINNL